MVGESRADWRRTARMHDHHGRDGLVLCEMVMRFLNQQNTAVRKTDEAKHCSTMVRINVDIASTSSWLSASDVEVKKEN